MRYAQAVTDEREKYRQEQKAICEGRITARSADGTLMDPTQAFEDAQARYVDACAPIIAQAYHDGNYDGFWQALSNATSTSDFLYYKNDAFHIIEQTIILTGLLDHNISDGALHDTSFARAVARDTIKNSDDHPNGVHRLLGRLYAWGDFNALKTSDPSFTAARNTVALGNRIMEELANSCTNDEELINNALKLCTPTGPCRARVPGGRRQQRRQYPLPHRTQELSHNNQQLYGKRCKLRYRLRAMRGRAGCSRQVALHH